MSFCLLAKSSCVGEWGLLVVAPLTEPSRLSSEDSSSLGLLAPSGFTSPLTTVGTELLGGGEGDFALTTGSIASMRGTEGKSQEQGDKKSGEGRKKRKEN